MGSILNTWNAAMGSAGAVNDTFTKRAQEQAVSDLNYLQIYFESDAQKKLNELQQNDDYENWGTMMDEFLEEVNHSLSDKNNRNYYCKNEYTAKQAKLYLEGQRNNLQQKVYQMQEKYITEQDLVKYQNEKELLKQTTSGQNYLDSINASAKSLKAQNKLSPEQYDREIKNNWIDATTTTLSGAVESMIDSGIAAGKTYEQVWDDATASFDDLKLYGSDGLEIQVDSKNIRDKVKGNMQAKYNARVNDMQNKNDKRCEQNYANIAVGISNGSLSEQDAITRISAAKSMAQNMTGLKLDNGRQKYWIDAYDNLLREFEKGNGGSGGSGAKGQALRTLAETDVKVFVSFVKDGQIPYGIEAKTAMLDYLQQEIMAGKAKGFSADNPKQANEIITIEANDIVTGFYNAVFKDMCAKHLDVQSKINEISKEISDPKNAELIGDDTVAWVNSNLMDLAFTYDWESMSTNEIVKMIDNWKGAAVASKVEALSKKWTENYTEGEGTLFKNKADNQEYLAQVTNILENNDVVYRDDATGELHYKTDADKKAIQQYSIEAQKAVARTIGIETSDLRISHQKDNGSKYGDELSTLIFSDGKHQYRLVSDTKKNGKVKGVHIEDEKGNVYQIKYSNDNTQKEAKRAERKTQQELHNIEEQRMKQSQAEYLKNNLNAPKHH